MQRQGRNSIRIQLGIHLILSQAKRCPGIKQDPLGGLAYIAETERRHTHTHRIPAGMITHGPVCGEMRGYLSRPFHPSHFHIYLAPFECCPSHIHPHTSALPLLCMHHCLSARLTGHF